MDLRALSPVGFRIDYDSLRLKAGAKRESSVRLVALKRPKGSESHVYPPPYGLSEALLIELGSRRGEWVMLNEMREVYRLTSQQIKDGIGEIRATYPLIVVECRPHVGYRLTGPLPAHVERIASK